MLLKQNQQTSQFAKSKVIKFCCVLSSVLTSIIRSAVKRSNCTIRDAHRSNKESTQAKIMANSWCQRCALDLCLIGLRQSSAGSPYRVFGLVLFLRWRSLRLLSSSHHSSKWYFANGLPIK